MKVLIIAMAGIGDVLLSTPFLHELRLQYPEAQLDALVLWPGARDLLAGNPNLNAIHQKNFLKSSKPEILRFLLALRRERYDLSINTHPQSRIQYRIIARIIGARTRLSHRYDCQSWLDRFLVNRSIDQDYSTHGVENNFRLLSLLDRKQISIDPKVEIHLSSSDRQFAESLFAERRLDEKIRIGFHVGSGATKNLALKRWPLENYRELLHQLLSERPNVAAILLGGPEEEKDHVALANALPSGRLIIAGTKNIREAAAVLERCHAFVSVDTALMHLAAAMKVPNQVVIEAPTLNKTNEPYHQPFTLIKNPMVHGRNLDYYRYDGRDIRGTREHLLECMRSIKVIDVSRELSKILARIPLKESL